MKKKQPIPDNVINITVKTNQDKSYSLNIDHTEMTSIEFIGILEQVKYRGLESLNKKT